MVKEILLGDNPFLGVSHLAQEKARMELTEISPLEAKVEVVKAALEGGATGFTFSTHQPNLELLNYVGKYYPEILEKLNYYILTPYAQGYVRGANVSGTAKLVKTVVRNVALRNPVGFISSVVTANFSKVASLLIATEVDPYLRVLPRGRVGAILLHEVLTELVVAYNLVELLEELRRYVERRLGVGFGLETRNVGQLAEFLDVSGVRVEYVMTPINPLGYQMAPSKYEAEESVRKLADRGVKVIAVNILASGAVPLEQACRYLESYKGSIYAVAYGTAKPYRARGNAMLLKRCLLTA